MRVLVCGDRNWRNIEAIRRELAFFPLGTVIIHGGASGADSLSGVVGREFGFTIRSFPAQWDKYGKAAGPVRNTQMLREGQPDIILAFHENIESSKGTKNMITQARKAALPVKLITK
jgi:hypothetical protein